MGNRHYFQSEKVIIYLVIELIVYADVLIFLNLIVDYFLLLVTGKIIGKSVKTIRIVLSALIGSISSLYIFLPQQTVFLEFVFKMAICAILTVSCFGFGNFKSFFRNTGVLFIVTCAYAGLMFAFWIIFKPHGMVINNSVVYFNISPTVLVVCSVGGYILFTILSRVFARQSKFSKKCNITVFAKDRNIKLDAIVDTGNSIEDAFSESEIIITNRGQVESLFGSTDCESNSDLKLRYRILPCSTVSGYDTLEGFRCDRAEIVSDDKKTVVQKPILAISKTNLNDGYNAIVNPKILE